MLKIFPDGLDNFEGKLVSRQSQFKFYKLVSIFYRKYKSSKYQLQTNLFFETTLLEYELEIFLYVKMFFYFRTICSISKTVALIGLGSKRAVFGHLHVVYCYYVKNYQQINLLEFKCINLYLYQHIILKGYQNFKFANKIMIKFK